MPRVIAVIPTDLERSRLGLPSLLARSVCGKTVLQHTVDRLLRVAGIERIVLIHPPGQQPLSLLNSTSRKRNCRRLRLRMFLPIWKKRAKIFMMPMSHGT